MTKTTFAQDFDPAIPLACRNRYHKMKSSRQAKRSYTTHQSSTMKVRD